MVLHEPATSTDSLDSSYLSPLENTLSSSNWLTSPPETDEFIQASTCQAISLPMQRVKATSNHATLNWQLTAPKALPHGPGTLQQAASHSTDTSCRGKYKEYGVDS